MLNIITTKHYPLLLLLAHICNLQLSPTNIQMQHFSNFDNSKYTMYFSIECILVDAQEQCSGGHFCLLIKNCNKIMIIYKMGFYVICTLIVCWTCPSMKFILATLFQEKNVFCIFFHAFAHQYKYISSLCA